MVDSFFQKEHCDRCGGSLDGSESCRCLTQRRSFVLQRERTSNAGIQSRARRRVEASVGRQPKLRRGRIPWEIMHNHSSI